MKKIRFVFLSLFLLLLVPVFAQQGAFRAGGSQQQTDTKKPADDEEKRDEGIPVTNDIVKRSCGPCHKSDEKGRMTRISFRRTTPEGWQETIRRMVSLNKVQLEPKDAREIVRYLSSTLGLAPEEARPGTFEVERRMIDYKYTDRDTEQTCIRCHSFGRILLQRRTKEEWELLLAMHRGYYPLVDFQAFRRGGPPQTLPGPDGRPPDNRHPMDKAINHLSEAFPLKTAEWSAWSVNMRPPKLEGSWALSGDQAGKGAVYGTMRIRASATSLDEFETETNYTYARSGQTVTRKGKTIVYTGYQWRGRSLEGSAEESALREVMSVDRDWREISGRWFKGAYDEFGLDIKLQRIGNDPRVLGVEPTSLKTSSSAKTVRIFGANLPTNLTTGDVDFGNGVRVTRVVTAAPNSATVEVEVASDAAIGARDVFVAGAANAGGVTIYNKVDGIKVFPQAGMARVGGVNFPKQFQQFEAIAYHNGPDGKPDTKDDLKLGMVEVAWSVEEYTATFGDDDKGFVGTLGADGLFTPNVDGPNPKRKNGTNNYGDVWIVATYTPSGSDKESKPIRARAHLLVTVPLYMNWNLSEVAR